MYAQPFLYLYFYLYFAMIIYATLKTHPQQIKCEGQVTSANSADATPRVLNGFGRLGCLVLRVLFVSFVDQ